MPSASLGVAIALQLRRALGNIVIGHGVSISNLTKETLIYSRFPRTWMCRHFRRLQGVENESIRKPRFRIRC